MSAQDIQTRFEAFNKAHPEVYVRLREMALQGVAAGAGRLGVKALMEIVRWEQLVRPEPGVEYIINNSFSAPYARLLMEREPRLAGVFETRHSPREKPHNLRVAQAIPSPSARGRDTRDASNEGAATEGAAPSPSSRDTPHSREAGAVVASPDATAPAPSFPANQSGGAKAGLAAGMAATLGTAPTLFEDDGPGLVGPAWNRRPGRAA